MKAKPNTKTENLKDLDPTFKEGQTRKRYRVQFDIGYSGSPGKSMDPDSDTIPDLNLTVRQLLENHTRGKGNDVEVRQPLYMEFPIPDLKDMTDVEEYKAKVQEQLERISQFQAENNIDPVTGQIKPDESLEQPDVDSKTGQTSIPQTKEEVNKH